MFFIVLEEEVGFGVFRFFWFVLVGVDVWVVVLVVLGLMGRFSIVCLWLYLVEICLVWFLVGVLMI